MSEDGKDHEIEALRDLVVHPGFRALCSHIADEWGAAKTLDRCKRVPVEQMPQVIAVSDAVMYALTWPTRQIHDLELAKRKANRPEPLVKRRA